MSENFELNNLVLAQRYLQEDHVAEYLYQTLISVFLEFKIEQKVLFVNR